MPKIFGARERPTCELIAGGLREGGGLSRAFVHPAERLVFDGYSYETRRISAIVNADQRRFASNPVPMYLSAGA